MKALSLALTQKGRQREKESRKKSTGTHLIGEFAVQCMWRQRIQKENIDISMSDTFRTDD